MTSRRKRTFTASLSTGRRPGDFGLLALLFLDTIAPNCHKERAKARAATLAKALTTATDRGIAMASRNIHRLSELFTDPYVKAAFARAERDNGEPAMALVEPAPRLIDGAAVDRELELA